MATVVSHIELENGISDVRLPEGYAGLMALVTLHGVPLGDITIKADGGSIPSSRILDEVMSRHCGLIAKQWIEQNTISSRKTLAGSERSIAVIIPTCDRPPDLRRCLESIPWESTVLREVIVVDNGSNSDETYETVDRCGARYVREKRRGLDFARNAGLSASHAEFVAFADDDVIVDERWLDSIVEAFRSDSGIACVTGLTMPMELETEAQEQFENYSSGGLRRGYTRPVRCGWSERNGRFHTPVDGSG